MLMHTGMTSLASFSLLKFFLMKQ